MGNKLFPRRRWMIEIPASQTPAGDAELSFNTHWYGLKLRIQKIDLFIIDGPADRDHRLAIISLARPARGIDRGFRVTVDVMDWSVELRKELPLQLRPHCFAAAEE